MERRHPQGAVELGGRRATDLSTISLEDRVTHLEDGQESLQETLNEVKILLKPMSEAWIIASSLRKLVIGFFLSISLIIGIILGIIKILGHLGRP